ncbi:MAG: aldo/keto reductase [Gemmatimonadales bacterium]|nr:aldo/keto reductase [Gemmatimonadales bacterium]MBA3709302.1 aldo/keto reductase [Planctomycetota bacterium]
MKYGSVVGVSKPVSRVALGTMIITTREYEQSCRLLDAAMKLGCSTLDTAYVYAGGESERAIGKWMKERNNREQVVVLTKGCHHNQDRKRVTPFDISADLHDSLARLQTSYVDIYLLHRDDTSVPVGPIVEALNEHHRAGRIRAFGGSNWTHERMQQANDYAKSKNLVPFTASSPNFSLAEQVNDPWGPGCVTISGPQQEGARAWYRSANMPMFAYSSLARGLLSGRVSRANFETSKQQLDDACRNAYCHEVNFQRLDRVEQLAKEKGVTVPQLSMAWIMNQPLNAFALVGAANEQELAATIAGAELKLSAEDCAWLDLKSATRAAKG